MTTSTTIFQDVGLPFMVMILSITRFLSTPPLFFLSSSQNTENLIKLEEHEMIRRGNLPMHQHSIETQILLVEDV